MIGLRKKLPFICFIILILPLMGATAAADNQNITEESTTRRQFSLGAGFEYLDIDGNGETLRPYGQLDSHPVVSGELLTVSPDKGLLDINLRWEGDTYHRFSGRYNYLGNIDLELTSDQFPVNREHLMLPPPTEERPVPTYNPEDQDPGKDYSTDAGRQWAHLKLRAPSYPAHLTLAASHYTRQGDHQQIFLDENCITECHNISQTRELDMTTNQFIAGADVHTGYLDTSYHYRYTDFSDGEPDPVHSYGILFGRRDPGEYTHNAFPEIRSFDHHLAFSTTNTGRITASLGLGMGQRENRDAGIEQNYRSGAADLVWRPHRKVAVDLKYHHYNRDQNTSPEVDALRMEAENPTNLEYSEDEVKATINFYPGKGWTLRGTYKHEQEERKEADAWDLPDKTTTDTWKLLGKWRPLGGLVAEGYLRGQKTDDPPYSTVPTDEYRGFLSLNWQIAPPALFQGSALFVRGENDDTSRKEDRDIYTASLFFTFEVPVTLGLIYYRFRDDVSTPAGWVSSDNLILDPEVPYNADGNQFVIQASWQATERLGLEAHGAYLDAEGAFATGAPGFEDVGLYSEFEAVQKEFFFGIFYGIGSGWELEGTYTHSDYDDRISAEGDETANEFFCFVNKRW